MTTVGIIVNPHAGKDLRRLVSAAGHTSDSVKIGILRRAIAGAAEAGAERILLSADTHRLGERAAEGLAAAVEIVHGPMTSSRLDSVIAAQEMWKAEAGCVVTLGGDGTCRDAATGWPQLPMIAISTGTNNVFPRAVDATSAGLAAGLIAGATIALDDVGTPSKRLVAHVEDPQVAASHDEVALVDVAMVTGSFVGARAVTDPNTIRWVAACIAEPASTGLAGIAGRVHPVSRHNDGGVLVRVGAGGRRVRVPLSPGAFDSVDIAGVQQLTQSGPVELEGGGVLAFDGERTLPVSAGATITVSLDTAGPVVVDVEQALRLAARAGYFQEPASGT